MGENIHKVTKQNRSYPSVSMKIADLPPVDSTLLGPIDEQFMKLYLSFLKGKTQAGYTRLRLDDITPGHYVKDGESNIHQLHQTDAFGKAVANGIRSGGRPQLIVYWSQLCPKNSKWVCTDDQNILLGYKKLGFTFVPCTVLKPARLASEHAVIVVRKSDGPEISGIFQPLKAERAAVFRSGKSARADLKLGKKSLSKLRYRLKEHTLQFEQQTTYHSMLVAVLDHQLACICYFLKMQSDGQYDLAAGVVRQAYEGLLNLYLDWLSPEKIGSILELKSSIASIGYDDIEAKSLRKLFSMKFGKLADLIENTAKKSEINPIGRVIHRELYSELSAAAHQTYRQIQRRIENSETSLQTEFQVLERYLNVIVSGVYEIVRNETGSFLDD